MFLEQGVHTEREGEREKERESEREKRETGVFCVPAAQATFYTALPLCVLAPLSPGPSTLSVVCRDDVWCDTQTRCVCEVLILFVPRPISLIHFPCPIFGNVVQPLVPCVHNTRLSVLVDVFPLVSRPFRFQHPLWALAIVLLIGR